MKIEELLKGSIVDLHTAYADGALTPADVVGDIVARAEQLRSSNIWITPPSIALSAPYIEALAGTEPDSRPLWGVPFAIKDNIDLAGVPTTAACPALTYTPTTSAFVVQRLIDAGAIPVGKTNLDQLATGLVGTRSPYGATSHPERPEHISGGSSAGSAVAVSCGLASFALGTDTAGSGRVPAGFNGIVGFKATCGLLSTTGVVPACRTIDCVSLFAQCIDDAALLAAIAAQEDEDDPYSRANPYANNFSHVGTYPHPVRLAVIEPSSLTFFGDSTYADAYARSIAQLERSGFTLIPISFEPFAAAARELYEGPWVTERYLTARPLLETDPAALLGVTRTIIAPGGDHKATDVYESKYRLAELRKRCLAALADVDALLTPTAPRHYRHSEVAEEPIVTNTNLGYYTNYMNLLDLCGVAVPALATSTDMPFGLTLIADRFRDAHLLSLASRVLSALHDTPALNSPFSGNAFIDVAVCGAHLSGLPLNPQLTDRGAQLVETTTTAPGYRMYALSGGPPYRPGLIKDAQQGSEIDVEVWRMPQENFGSFVAGIPWPLGIGQLSLADGRSVSGFICEGAGIEGAQEITHLGGWRRYLETR